MDSLSALPFPGASQTGGADHDRVIEHGAVIDQLKAGQARVEAKLDRLELWLFGLLASAVGGLILNIFNSFRGKS